MKSETNSQLPSTSFTKAEVNDYLEHNHPASNEFKFNECKTKHETKKFLEISDKKSQTVNTDDSENSSEEKGHSRKERKPLPLIFDRSYCGYNNDSSSEASEDTKEIEPCKCEYLGERETLKSFWDKCLYQCFTSKRCVAGEKPKRKYRKKMKIQKLPTKKRKHLNPPFSCIDLKDTAVKHNG